MTHYLQPKQKVRNGSVTTGSQTTDPSGAYERMLSFLHGLASSHNRVNSPSYTISKTTSIIIGVLTYNASSNQLHILAPYFITL